MPYMLYSQNNVILNTKTSRTFALKTSRSHQKKVSTEGNDVWEFYHSFSILTDQDDELTPAEIQHKYGPKNIKRELRDPTLKLPNMKTPRLGNPSVIQSMSFRGASSSQEKNTLCKKTIPCLPYSSKSIVEEQNLEMKSDMIRKISFKTTADIKWNARYNELVEYHNKFGHSNVPNRYIPNKKLGVWVRNQRSQFKKSQLGKHTPLNSSRIKALKKLGFEFDYLDAQWNRRYCELKEFKESYGHCNVPHRYKANHKLGEWVGTQRTQYKRKCLNLSSHLNTKRIQALSALDFVWTLRDECRL